MLCLIRREIRDHLVFVLAPCVVGLLAIVLEIHSFLSGMALAVAGVLMFVMSVSFVILCILGVAQMYGDRANRISALLCTLAVTRNRILAARVLVGMLTVLAAVVPAAVAAIVLVRLLVPGGESWYGTIIEVSATTMLTGFACYCGGLLIGWTTNRAWLLAGGVLLLGAIASLLHIKGLGPETMAVLLLFTVAALLRVWQRFAWTSL